MPQRHSVVFKCHIIATHTLDRHSGAAPGGTRNDVDVLL